MAHQKLNDIIGKLSNEYVIQTQITNLVGKWKYLRDQLLIIVSVEGYAVYRRKSILLSKIRPKKKHVVKLREAVLEFRYKLREWTDKARETQAENHEVVETCRARKIQRRREIESISLEIDITSRKIDSLQSDIETCGTEAYTCDASAQELEGNAARSKNRRDNHLVAAAVGNGVALGFGLVLAPFTGGLSLGLGALGATANTVVHGTGAVVNNSDANFNERRANEKRDRARRLRQKIENHKQDISEKNHDISQLRRNEDELEESSIILADVEQMIYMFINGVEERLCNIQDVEMLMQEAINHGDQLSIILSALERYQKKGFFRRLFGRKPKYLDNESEELQNKIQEKWSEVESMILPHGNVLSVSTGLHKPYLM